MCPPLRLRAGGKFTYLCPGAFRSVHRVRGSRIPVYTVRMRERGTEANVRTTRRAARPPRRSSGRRFAAPRLYTRRCRKIIQKSTQNGRQSFRCGRRTGTAITVALWRSCGAGRVPRVRGRVPELRKLSRRRLHAISKPRAMSVVSHSSHFKHGKHLSSASGHTTPPMVAARRLLLPGTLVGVCSPEPRSRSGRSSALCRR